MQELVREAATANAVHHQPRGYDVVDEKIGRRERDKYRRCKSASIEVRVETDFCAPIVTACARDSGKCSRLIVGTGRYDSMEVMRDSLAHSGSDCLTVAVRRERL